MDKLVPHGISLPTTTFSFKPLKKSFFPFTAASVKTLVVSWKEAADINESVTSDALVIPRRIDLYVGNSADGLLYVRSSINSSIAVFSICSPTIRSVSPVVSISTFLSI